MSLKLLQILLISFIFQNTVSSPGKDQNVTANKHSRRHKNAIKQWEFESDDHLEYPRGDKQKLERLSKLWSDHYACLARLSRRVTSSGRLPAVYKAAMEGAVVTLPCALCVAPGEHGYVCWLKARSQETAFEPITPQYHMVTQDNGDLSIFGVRIQDGGFYKCEIGHSIGGLIVLEVGDAREYNVVKPQSTDGPYPAPSTSLYVGNTSIRVFTVWSPWSECSVCGSVGRRRRRGMCYIKLDNKRNKQAEQDNIEETTQLGGTDVILQRALRLFSAFPGGIPCRSHRLPNAIRKLPAVGERRDEIMLGLCKVKCAKGAVFEVRTTRGAVLERANNTAGVFSLWQPSPMPAPKFVADILFVARREPFNLTCPGISLRDIPISWRVGTKILNPRTVDRESNRRVHLNARDQLVIANVKYSDANLYSCWQREALLGTVKLVVWEGSHLRWNHHALLLLMLVGAGILLRAIDRVVDNKRRRLGMV